jgi:hypothetical protein
LFATKICNSERWLEKVLKILNFFKAGKKCVLYCKASLIAASDAKTTRALA